MKSFRCGSGWASVARGGWLLAAMVVFAASATADLVPPVISSDVTWTRAGNPWIVASNVLVKSGATLHVEAGAVVEFTGNWKLEIDGAAPASDIVVHGAPYDSVYFRAAGGSGAAGQWQGIRVTFGAGSSFDYCVVLHARDALWLNTSNAPITHCAFRRCRTGIWCLKSSPDITSCSVSETSLAGIFCEGVSVTPPISQPVIFDCNLFDNAGYNVYMHNYTWAGSTTVMAVGNWWGTSVESEIEESILDFNDDPGGCNATVVYDPWREQTPVEQRTWGAIKALFRD